jgi:multiple sugar transport system permease protein
MTTVQQGDTPKISPKPAAARKGTDAPGEVGARATSKIIMTAVLVLVALYFVVPIYWVIIAATKDATDLTGTNGLWFGHSFKLLSNLKLVFTENGHIFGRWLVNSVIYAGVGALVATYLAAACGYALAKYKFRGNSLIFALVLGGVLVPSTATALPLFLLFSKLGLANTYWGVLLPSMVSPFGMFLARIYAGSSVDTSLMESARIDGASEIRIFHVVALRTLTPALVTVFLFQLVDVWNNYFLPLIMLSNDRLFPVTLGLAVWQTRTDRLPIYYQMTIGGVLVSIIPLVVAMIVLQRFWRGGLTEGSVKG